MRLLLLLVGLGLAACDDDRELRVWRPSDHDQPEGERTGQVAAGGRDMSIQILYARLCVTCHGQDGRGSAMPGIRAPDLTASRKSDDEMVQTILRGKGRMPAFGSQVTAEDARELVRMLRRM